MTPFDKLHRGGPVAKKAKVRPPAPPAAPPVPDHLAHRAALAKRALAEHPPGSPGRAAAVQEAEAVGGDLRKLASERAAEACFKVAFANPQKMGAGL